VASPQVYQKPALETMEGTSISIKCTHPKIESTDFIQWYRQLPGREPELLVSTLKEFEELPAIAGQLSVSPDGRSSWLWLGRPGRGDAAVYYCALGP
ncbi:TVAZ2 protein, partial [Sylvia borin]|nr:TVAZ2 protein [Sylvia borin]